ncbi:MAG TPA: ABC transporter ATP-binding protein [Anaerolineales bacterium]|nr:ABC transporter ATP-binding protein [Anaerolineales bacterium]
MSSSAIVIKVEHLSKCYNIYNRPQDRLKQAIIPRLQRLVSRPPIRYFHEFWALRDVSFEVHKGETIGIIGRNGSGKSTLLQLVCGTLSPTSGTLTTEGRIAALLELGSGFNPEFTGRENVYLNAAILGLSNEEINERFDAIASFANIDDFMEQPTKIYSSGMMLRLAFAVQAMVEPDILIVDEALAVGDEKFQRKCFARLEELKSKGTSILFVSHSSSQILELCDRALLLESGEKLMLGQPSRVINAYQKLIYSPISQQEDLVKQFRDADQTVIGTDLAPMRSSGDEDSSLGQISIGAAPLQEALESNFFDQTLIPASTVIYPIQGAEINSLRILNAHGQSVNLLSFGQIYRFELSGTFLTERKNVYIGIHIRTISGLVLTGQRYPEEGQYIEKVHAGEHFALTFGFKMNLSSDTYFSGCGIWSLDEPQCLHRIIDAVMFRILPEPKVKFLGYLDVSSMEPILKTWKN